MFGLLGRSMQLRRILPLFAFGFLVTLGAEIPTAAPVSEAQLKNLKARAIGPAIMGGRISDIALDPRNPAVFYVGYATSGVWKSSNSGVTLSPIFDDQPAQSIGAVAVAVVPGEQKAPQPPPVPWPWLS